ncbi:hypothetical protein EWM64_g8117 [Hericium alpestre]|uniref:Uncharacterized protein n=1 Tax=Hericium alpestre TaxID=135208 RepID=A0A4Y9ZPC0_9AGAM|nr:hypothetical protein EWM64_g8117 [Hericium alpestre]
MLARLPRTLRKHVTSLRAVGSPEELASSPVEVPVCRSKHWAEALANQAPQAPAQSTPKGQGRKGKKLVTSEPLAMSPAMPATTPADTMPKGKAKAKAKAKAKTKAKATKLGCTTSVAPKAASSTIPLKDNESEPEEGHQVMQDERPSKHPHTISSEPQALPLQQQHILTTDELQYIDAAKRIPSPMANPQVEALAVQVDRLQLQLCTHVGIVAEMHDEHKNYWDLCAHYDKLHDEFEAFREAAEGHLNAHEESLGKLRDGLWGLSMKIHADVSDLSSKLTACIDKL